MRAVWRLSYSLAKAVSRSARWRTLLTRRHPISIHDRCDPQVPFDTNARPSDDWAISYAVSAGAVLEQQMYYVEAFRELQVQRRNGAVTFTSTPSWITGSTIPRVRRLIALPSLATRLLVGRLS